MNPFNDSPAVVIHTTDDIVDMEANEQETLREIEESASKEQVTSGLASMILRAFQDNITARQTSGIEEKMLQSLRAYNGHYDPEDLKKIREINGSDIFMNLTPTKCRAAMSWIRDIMLPAKERSWLLEPSPVPEISPEAEKKIKEQVEAFMEALQAEEQQKQQQQQQQQQQQAPQAPQGQPQEGAAPQGPQPQGAPAPPQGGPQAPPAGPQQEDPMALAAKLKAMNDLQRDFRDAYKEEIYKLAKRQLESYEEVIADQLAEGGWTEALSDFIEDFCVFQVAIMKGPIITKKKRISWVGGKPKSVEDYVFCNKRVSPLDMYPSPSATKITDGNLCEHIRLHANELRSFIGVPNYDEEAIRGLLERGEETSVYSFMNTNIEDEKDTEEYRGDTYQSSKGVYHGVHYFGTATYNDLRDHGIPEDRLGPDTSAVFEVEAIMVADTVIKAVLNKDPLLRRPYYKASFQNIPGSWWGRSLPELMRDIQRMCNATARALANNIGIASGPQIELYIDRLAADEDVESIYPFRTWQATSDPGGGSGRAVNFWQPTSNAQELLTVYKEFEVRADDATGIPRYAYGNERTGGAAQTASGLSMLLESASKGIKDSVRHIDDGLITPRVEYQFYWNIISNPEEEFTGDVVVIPKGSQALTLRGAQEMRRNEFLQILANPMYLEIVGIEGVASILREMAKGLGLGDDVVPSRMELKYQQKMKGEAQAAKEQQLMEMEKNKEATGVKQVQMQTQQAEAASQRKAQLEAAKMQRDEQVMGAKLSLEAEKIRAAAEKAEKDRQADLVKQQMVEAGKDRNTNKNIALSVRSGFQDKSNQQ